ncbi:DEKNAAC101478 [Brettanomyces naardenensis]|uniref:DEKNAAC101478 n=1 Tax=Brettanomyces naardenensis TaxID=13370 RepID=A0A448YHZ0_BRENA|nr:DEKNAAC101478 [Brettanomyces naardenensis]
MAQKNTARKPKSDKESGSKTKLPKLPSEYIVRPHDDGKGMKNVANIYVSPQLLEITEWTIGSFIKVLEGLNGITCILSTWSEVDDDKYDLNVVLVSPYYLSLAGILLGDRVELVNLSAQPDYAVEVEVDYISSIDEQQARKTVQDIGLIYEGLTTEKIHISDIHQGIDKEMKRLSLGKAESATLRPFLYHPRSTKLVFTKKDEISLPRSKYTFQDIGGLDKEISLLKKNIYLPLNCPEVFEEFGIQPPRGILLYGASGTGKSLLLRTVAYESPKCHIIRINGPSIVSKYLGGTEERLRDYFKEAVKYAPSMILIDEIDSLVPTRNSDDSTEVDSRVIATMLTLLDSLDGPVLVIGATNRIGSVDVSLRRPGRFDQELEIPIPDANDRYDILLKQFGKMKDRSTLKEDEIRNIANKTHGYVGADLLSLTREAITKCISREIGEDLQDHDLHNVKVTYNDLQMAMQEVRPSAMREIVLEMPKVRWSDIGGQEVLKRKLREMVQLPLTASETFERLGISAPKGLLLYGPPGCSKTMTAKALASESGLNFLAIKGPEIFNKYVGESEKKIREIFRKARMSAPSIIFIDEIDALATSRDSADSTNVSQQVLNTLLNEIDGVEELKGVIIIGATNRPDSIDPALLRPGRLDRHVYVSPPDSIARRQIFEKNTEQFELDDKEGLLERLVELTEGFSGSECVLLCQEAGLNAIMEDNKCEKVAEGNFMAALKDISKNITEEMLEYYRLFAKKYASY